MYKILEDGRIVIPVAVHDESNGAIGDMTQIIDPSHADYQEWLEWIEKYGHNQVDSIGSEDL